MIDLSGNTELKNAIFNKVQIPKIKFFWKDGDVNQKDFSHLIMSANGTIEMEDFDRQITKNTFNLELDNNNDIDCLGFFFPENSGSIGENVRVETGYEHNGTGSETIVMTKGKIRSLSGNSHDKKSQITALDEGKNLDREITVNSLLTNKYPYQLIQEACAQVGYLPGNTVGNKKLIIKSLDASPSVDESLFLVKYYAIAGDLGWDIIQEICEASLGKFFIDRNGDFNYWTYNYWISKFSINNENLDFTAKTLIAPADNEIVPIIEQGIELSYGNLVNKTDVSYNLFKQESNIFGNEISLELFPGETFHYEGDNSGGYVLSYDDVGFWAITASDDPSYGGIDHGEDIEVTNVTNLYKKLTFDVKNNSSVYYYVKIKPQVISQVTISSKKIEQVENSNLFSDGNYNYNLNKENKKSIQNTLIQSKEWAKQLGFLYMDLYRKPIRTIEIKTTGFPNIDLGDIGKYLNYAEIKSTEVKAWVKRINWSFNPSDGFTMDILGDIISSTSGALGYFILEYFLDNTKIDLVNSNIILGEGYIEAFKKSDGFESELNLVLIDSFGSDGTFMNSNASLIDISTGKTFINNDGYGNLIGVRHYFSFT